MVNKMDREHTIHIEPFILLPPNDAEKMSFLYLLDSEKKTPSEVELLNICHFRTLSSDDFLSPPYQPG